MNICLCSKLPSLYDTPALFVVASRDCCCEDRVSQKCEVSHIRRMAIERKKIAVTDWDLDTMKDFPR
jgi:hypothetical protein